MNELSELVYDTMKSGFLEFGWSIPTDVMSQVADLVREAVENHCPGETDPEQTTAYLEEVAEANEQTLTDHEKRIVALERAVRLFSRPKKLRRTKDEEKTVDGSEGLSFDLDAVQDAVGRERENRILRESYVENPEDTDTFGPTASMMVQEAAGKLMEYSLPNGLRPVEGRYKVVNRDLEDVPVPDFTETLSDCLEGELS